MPLSESGQKIVDTFTRQVSALVEKVERSENEKQELIEQHAGECDRLVHERDTLKAELIDKKARLDETQGQLVLSNAELGTTQRELNAQTAALESLRRSASAFGLSIVEVLGKNVEADKAAENIETMLAELAQRPDPELAQIEGPRQQ